MLAGGDMSLDKKKDRTIIIISATSAIRERFITPYYGHKPNFADDACGSHRGSFFHTEPLRLLRDGSRSLAPLPFAH